MELTRGEKLDYEIYDDNSCFKKNLLSSTNRKAGIPSVNRLRKLKNISHSILINYCH